MVDKQKLEMALIDFGLSKRRAEELADYLEDKDLAKRKKRRKKLTTKDINEVKSYHDF
jgi:hypothetical protein